MNNDERSGIPGFFLFPFINESECTIDLKLNKILISIIHVFIASRLCFVKLDFHLNGFVSGRELAGHGAQLGLRLTWPAPNLGRGYGQLQWAQPGGAILRATQPDWTVRLLGDSQSQSSGMSSKGAGFLHVLSASSSHISLSSGGTVLSTTPELLSRFSEDPADTGTLDIVFPFLGGLGLLLRGRVGLGLGGRFRGNCVKGHDSLAAWRAQCYPVGSFFSNSDAVFNN